MGGLNFISGIFRKNFPGAVFQLISVHTRTHTLTPFIKSGTAFDNSLRNEKINSVRVLRFPVIPQNRYLSFFFEKLIQRQRDQEERESSSYIRKIVNDSLLEQESSLADGWNQIERYGESSMRWTKSEASFSINDSNISKISFFLTNPKKIPTQIEVSAEGYCEQRTVQTVAALSFRIVSTEKYFRLWSQ